MTTIKIDSKCNKQFRKEDSNNKKSIKNALASLIYKLQMQGKDLDKIYNNPAIIHDRINDQIYMFKFHGLNKTQFRILYGYEKRNKDSILYFIDYTSKKKNSTEYMEKMNDKFRGISISELNFIPLETVS